MGQRNLQSMSHYLPLRRSCAYSSCYYGVWNVAFGTISFSESKSYASEIYNRYPAIHLLRRACAYVSCYYGFWNVPSGITQIHIYAQVYI